MEHLGADLAIKRPLHVRRELRPMPMNAYYTGFGVGG